MFFVWVALSGLYAYETVKLLAVEDCGGGLIVGILALGFAVLAWRSFQARKKKKAQRAAKTTRLKDKT